MFFVNSVSSFIKCKTKANTTVCMRIPEFNSLQFSSFENHVKREDNLKKNVVSNADLLYATCSLVNTNFLSDLQILHFQNQYTYSQRQNNVNGLYSSNQTCDIHCIGERIRSLIGCPLHDIGRDKNFVFICKNSFKKFDQKKIMCITSNDNDIHICCVPMQQHI